MSLCGCEQLYRIDKNVLPSYNICVSGVEFREPNRDEIGKIIRDLSGYLSLKLNALGFQRYGIDKDDLVQEINIRIWQAYENNNHNIKYLKSYLKKVVHSVFVDEIRRIGRENEALKMIRPQLNQSRVFDRWSPAEGEILMTVLASSIEDLKESKRLVVKLYLEGFKVSEIASLNQWSYRKTYLTFCRGVKDLRHTLRKRGQLQKSGGAISPRRP